MTSARRFRHPGDHPRLRPCKIFFSGIIAGIALQISKPYKVGDWLKIKEHFAEVMEINWRSTRLRTNDAIYLDIPNNEIVRGTIINLHYPTQIHAMRIRVGVDYEVPPNRVKDALFRATSSAEGVVPSPPIRVFVVDFAESAVIYEIKFSMGNHQAYNEVSDAIRTNIWYEFKRQRITIPFPIRTLHVQRRRRQSVPEGHAEAQAILRSEPLFDCLNDAQLDHVLHGARIHRYGRGERLIEEGAEGDSMFVMLRGTAHVSVLRNGTGIRLGVLREGDCFGEMSLLTGEPRSATIRAEGDCEVLEIKQRGHGRCAARFAPMPDAAERTPGQAQTGGRRHRKGRHPAARTGNQGTRVSRLVFGAFAHGFRIVGERDRACTVSVAAHRRRSAIYPLRAR